MATNPSFISTPRIGRASLSAANTALDGTGTITELIAGVAAGTRILQIDAQCAATSAAALVNLFLSDDSGSTWTLFDQIGIVAATVSNTVKANRNFTLYTNLTLPSATWRIGCTTTIAQATRVYAFGGDLT
jgi:hypothetical protein